MSDLWQLGLILVAALLLVVLGRVRRKTAPATRGISALARLRRGIGLSVEDGSRILIGLGGPPVITRSGAAGLAGLALLREIAQGTSISDRPTVAAAGDSTLALLAQDTILAGYRNAGATEYHQPTTARLTGLTPFSAAAGTLPILNDEDVSTAALLGHFGVESALLADTAERRNVILIGSSDDPSAQAALFASAAGTLIGEELFAAPAYLGGTSSQSASLTVQDILRWLFILGLLAGIGLRVFGLI